MRRAYWVVGVIGFGVSVAACGDTYVKQEGSGAAAGSTTMSGGAMGGAGGTSMSTTGGAGGTAVECGDGKKEGAEECDDGNTLEGDGCTADCRVPACGDGKLDIGEFCFETMVSSELPLQGVNDFTLVDCDGDKDLDLVGVSTDQTAFAVLRNDGSGAYGMPSPTEKYLAAGIRGVDSGTYAFFNAPNIGVAFDYSSYNKGVVLKNDSKCGFDNAQPIEFDPVNAQTKMGGTVVLVDMEGDSTGHDVAFGADKALVWSPRDAASTVKEIALTGPPTHMRAGFVDATMGQDVVMTIGDELHTALSLGNQMGFQVAKVATLTGVAAGLAVADIDGDGRDDAVVPVGSGMTVLRNNESTFDTLSFTMAMTNDLGPVAVGDIDGDKVIDVIAGSTKASTIAVFRGGSNGMLEEQDSKMTPHPLTELMLRDVNGDGHLDMVMSHAPTDPSSKKKITVALQNP